MVREMNAVVGTGSRVTLEHKGSLNYTRAVVLELLRYITVLPLSVPHLTMNDTELCGTSVPAGTNVSAKCEA